MTMGAKVFVDTNILLRATVSQFPDHAKVKAFLESYIANEHEAWISRQVIREYINQVTRPQLFMQPMSSTQINAQYQTLKLIFRIADETEPVTDQLLALIHMHPTGGKQIHDANIIATMLVYDITTLLTINVDDMKRFSDKVTVISPYPETT